MQRQTDFLSELGSDSIFYSATNVVLTNSTEYWSFQLYTCSLVHFRKQAPNAAVVMGKIEGLVLARF